MEIEDKDLNQKKSSNALVTWLKRIGVLGFLFFLIKGLIWLAIIYGGFKIGGCD